MYVQLNSWIKPYHLFKGKNLDILALISIGISRAKNVKVIKQQILACLDI